MVNAGARGRVNKRKRNQLIKLAESNRKVPVFVIEKLGNGKVYGLYDVDVEMSDENSNREFYITRPGRIGRERIFIGDIKKVRDYRFGFAEDEVNMIVYVRPEEAQRELVEDVDVISHNNRNPVYDNSKTTREEVYA